jgi:hypothetical protein
MRRLEAFPVAPSTSRYPWAEVFDGAPWELTHGEDFDSKPSTFIANARAQAKRRGGSIKSRTIVTDDRTVVVLQFRPVAE